MRWPSRLRLLWARRTSVCKLRPTMSRVLSAARCMGRHSESSCRLACHNTMPPNRTKVAFSMWPVCACFFCPRPTNNGATVFREAAPGTMAGIRRGDVVIARTQSTSFDVFRVSLVLLCGTGESCTSALHIHASGFVACADFVLSSTARME